MKNRKRPKEWFDNQSYWRLTYPFLFSEQRFADAPEQVDKILALARPAGTSALDLCCGPGRCSVALAERGFSVTGVDRTKYLLNKARGRASAAQVRIEWIDKDMRDFARLDTYDLALSMFTSFGYFANKRDDVTVLENVFTSLREGGVFLIELMGKEILARGLQLSSTTTLPDGSLLVEQHTILDGWDRLQNDWTVIQHGRAQRFTFQLNLYSGRELRDQMERVGFAEVKLYGNLDGEPYGREARRLVAVGKKAKTRGN